MKRIVFQNRWTEERANAWYDEKGWLIGCNYAPSTAINQIEMWQAETFDPLTIQRELSWAASLGFNTIRVFLHDLLWKQDANGFKDRIDKFLSIADSYGIGVMIVIFDGVWDPNPELAKRDPKPFVHNSGWLQSPGAKILKDVNQHDVLEDYVKDIITHFAEDKRIHVWDLFNEPDNVNPTSYLLEEPENKGELSLALLKKAFQWAREINPSQPLTSGLWYGDWSDHDQMKEMDCFMTENSDVISFHNYDGPEEMEKRILALKRYNRPILCTEYMARTFQSTFENILPILKEYRVGAYNWGFVAGRTQTCCPWDSWLTTYDSEPPLWFHDIFHPDGKPYRKEEIVFITDLVEKHRHTNSNGLRRASGG